MQGWPKVCRRKDRIYIYSIHIKLFRHPGMHTLDFKGCLNALIDHEAIGKPDICLVAGDVLFQEKLTKLRDLPRNVQRNFCNGLPVKILAIRILKNNTFNSKRGYDRLGFFPVFLLDPKIGLEVGYRNKALPILQPAKKQNLRFCIKNHIGGIEYETLHRAEACSRIYKDCPNRSFMLPRSL